jgi:proline dehydrogenase
MLYGIRDTEQQRLVEGGLDLQAHRPHSDQWCGYFMRRLAERSQNPAFFLKSSSSTR